MILRHPVLRGFLLATSIPVVLSIQEEADAQCVAPGPIDILNPTHPSLTDFWMDDGVLAVSSYNNGQYTIDVSRHDGVGWNPELQISRSPNRAALIALHQDTLLAQVPRQNSSVIDVYRFDGSAWQVEQRLKPSDGASPYFGWLVALHGDVAAIVDRAPNEVYLFRRNGTVWQEEQKITFPYFVGQVSLGDGVLAVVDYSAGSDVFLYRYDGAQWNADPPLSFPVLISSLDMDDDAMVVGLSLLDVGGTDAGAAHVYRDDGQTMVLEQTVQPSDPVSNRGFGGSVAITGNLLAIGGSGGLDPATYAFRKAGGRWVEIQKMSETFPRRLGRNVEISGDRMFAQAQLPDEMHEFEVPSLVVTASPAQPLPGELLSLYTCGGLDRGDLVLFYTDPVLPLTIPVAVARFGSSGRHTLSGVVPAVLSGLNLSFFSVGHFDTDQAGVSDVTTVEVQ